MPPLGEELDLRPRNEARQFLGEIGGGDDVVLRRDDERWRADAGQLAAAVEGEDRVDAAEDNFRRRESGEQLRLELPQPLVVARDPEAWIEQQSRGLQVCRRAEPCQDFAAKREEAAEIRVGLGPARG